MDYLDLNDAAKYIGRLEFGSTEIWYQKEEFFRDGLMGMDWLKKQKIVPDVNDLAKNYVLLGQIKETDLDAIYVSMQGDNWSRQGESRTMIQNSGTGHTSMSVGDIIVSGDGHVFLVDCSGFEYLGQRSLKRKKQVTKRI